MIPIACLENIRHPTLNLIQMAVMMVVIVRLDLPLGSCTEHFEKRRGTHCLILRRNLGRADCPNHTAFSSALPMSWPRSPIMTSPHRKGALETESVSARACVHAVPDVLVHVPGVMFIFTIMSMSDMGSCRVMSAEVNGLAVNTRWDGMSIGMHCAAVSTRLGRDGIGRKTSESIIQQH